MEETDRHKKRVQGHIPSSTVVIPPCDPIRIHMGPPPQFFCHLICISKCDGSTNHFGNHHVVVDDGGMGSPKNSTIYSEC